MVLEVWDSRQSLYWICNSDFHPQSFHYKRQCNRSKTFLTVSLNSICLFCPLYVIEASAMAQTSFYDLLKTCAKFLLSKSSTSLEIMHLLFMKQKFKNWEGKEPERLWNSFFIWSWPCCGIWIHTQIRRQNRVLPQIHIIWVMKYLTVISDMIHTPA